MTNWRKYLLAITATTTEDRLWDFVSEQAKALAELAGDTKIDQEKKKQTAEAPYRAIREALKQLGVIR